MNNYAAKTRGAEFAERLGNVVRDPDFPSIMKLYKETYNVN